MRQRAALRGAVFGFAVTAFAYGICLGLRRAAAKIKTARATNAAGGAKANLQTRIVNELLLLTLSFAQTAKICNKKQLSEKKIKKGLLFSAHCDRIPKH